MLKLLQMWLKKDIIADFKEVSKDTGRTQVETFERMLIMFKCSEDYKTLVRLNNEMKNKPLQLVILGVMLCALSYLALQSQLAHETVRAWADVPWIQ
jgi:hypothetical protein